MAKKQTFESKLNKSSDKKNQETYSLILFKRDTVN